MANSKSVDSSLWWDSFSILLTELENVPLAADLPYNLANKLKDNHAWFIETFYLFKPRNEKSRDALNSTQVKIGPHQLDILPELQEKALEISSYLNLDEVQSYILVERSVKRSNVALDSFVQEFLHVILLQYYIERQCLLKCTRRILMHTISLGNGASEGFEIRRVALKLIADGLEGRLISALEDLLSSDHPEQMDIDLFTLWAEETLIEDNLVLDILFLAYYESFCTCNGEKWKKLCLLYKGIFSGSYNLGKLLISAEALHSSYQAKVQLLLILVETLDLENLLQMVHDEKPFRQDTNHFSLTDVQEMDAIVSSFNTFETKEAGPLIFTWAVFLCLISSLPGKEESHSLMEIDHVGYLRQAFEASALSYVLEILQSNLLNESDGPVAGYRSVLRTSISAFIASYEINIQLEDSTLSLILNILCNIYRGEESLCIQFWDKESFIDGPIRCLLCNLEGEFPFRAAELVRFLSSLCEGSWPAECVYNFLDKSVGISTLFEFSNQSMLDDIAQVVETHVPLHIPGIEGLLIPSNTRGHILRLVDGNTALVRWEYTHSGVHILLMRLAQALYADSDEEVLFTLDLLNRMISFNMAVCFDLINVSDSLHELPAGISGHMESTLWVVEIICTLVRNMSPNSSSTAAMAMGVNILAKMLKCSPSYVAAAALRANIFDVASNIRAQSVGCSGPLSGSWLLSGKLSKMLLIDSEQNDSLCPLTVSVLEFTMQLMEMGCNNDAVLALIVFSLQYILVNHEYWKYKVKHNRWIITLKVLEMINRGIMLTSSSGKLGVVLRDMLLCDSSIHNALFRIVCTTTQVLEKLYVSRHFDLMEIESLLLAIRSVLDILFVMLSKFSKDTSSSFLNFLHSVLSSANKPISVAVAVVSLISYFRNPAIQVGAAKVLSMLLIIIDSFQPYLSASSFDLDEKQLAELKNSLSYVLLEQPVGNENLFVATVNLLTSAAGYQPAFFATLYASNDNLGLQPSNSDDVKFPTNKISSEPAESKKPSLLDSLICFLIKSDDLIISNPHLLLNILNFFKALWQRAPHYTHILELMKSSEKFWKQLSNYISLTCKEDTALPENFMEKDALNLAYRYQCQSAILEIMAYDVFLEKKLLHVEPLAKQASETRNSADNSVSTEKSTVVKRCDHKDILSAWSQSSVLGNLLKLLTSYDHDNESYFHAKVAASLLIVHLLRKLESGNAGTLSISVREKISVISNKLRSHPAFSELIAQYSQRGYSEGKELHDLILSDLFYHLQGELEGRKITAGSFKELSQYLVESTVFQTHQLKHDSDLFITGKDVFVFDPVRIRADLGSDLWDYSKWQTSKAIMETMLHYMEDANLMVLITSSKLSAVKALVTVLTVYEHDSLESKSSNGDTVSNQHVLSCIDHVCKRIQAILESLAPLMGASKDTLHFLAAQTELLLHLMRSAHKNLTLSTCILVLKTSGSSLKVLSDFRPSITEVNVIMKLLLVLLLLTMEFSEIGSRFGGMIDVDSVEESAKFSNVCLGLLPILCSCVANAEHFTLSLTAMDLILRSFLTPNTWFPIIRNHIHLQHVILKLQVKNSHASIPIILRFSLTLARVREGAEMLLNNGFLSSLRFLFSEYLDGPFSVTNKRSLPISCDKIEKPPQIWGLGLAVITAMVQSLGDSSSCKDILDNVMPYLFSEKAYMISYHLSAPDFPSDDHDKKRPRAQRTLTSVTALKETQHTLMLMCELAKHWNSWVKAMKEMNSHLREQSIHLLAFISRGTQRLLQTSSGIVPLLCPPVLKEEFDFCKKPPFVNSSNGWFALSPHGQKYPTATSTTALTVRNQATETVGHDQTYFSDIVALQLYKNAFLLLKFLCLQAEGAAERAEAVGYVDLAHFPELPMPEILHGLQDQAIAIVTELCEANKMKQIQKEVQNICCLLLQIMEMALYLELCVLQICGIRPVLGRVEDFSKEVKHLMRATEGHAFLKASMKSLKQIISCIYPGLLQEDEFHSFCDSKAIAPKDVQ